jgi:predicted secreted hydrolase
MRMITLIVLSLSVMACAPDIGPAEPESSAAVSEFLTTSELAGYERALAPRPLAFPRDHASHPQFKTEWWYFTGNLSDAQSRLYGFQLTFFRFALAPNEPQRESPWRSHQAWMGHLAITDAANGEFLHTERFSRDGLGLAGNSVAPFRLWLEDWSATATGPAPFPLRLLAGTREAGLDLTLMAGKSPVAHGEGGLDRKGPEAGNASYYYSMPRLPVEGELRIGEARHDVTGSAWMDREWSTNSLSPELAGWDWLSVELSDGRDLMLYRLRTTAGESSPFSSGTLIAADGRATRLERDDFVLEAREHWTSEATGSRYPIGWSVELPEQNLRLEVRPLIPNQEMNLTVRYWEGAVVAQGTGDGESLTGRGYLELTGY